MARARRRDPRRADAVLHGRRRGARRPRRRRRVRRSPSGRGGERLGLRPHRMRQRVAPRGRHARDRVRAGRRHGRLGAVPAIGVRADRRRARRDADPAPDRRRPPGRPRRAARHASPATRTSRSSARPPTAPRRSTLAEPLRPDVVLMDLRMPACDGAAAIRRARRARQPGAGARADDVRHRRDVLPAIEAGATGYLLKDAPRDELVRAVRAAHRGESVLAPSVATRLDRPAARAGAGRAERARARGPHAGRRGRDQPRRGRAPVHQRGDRQDPPAAHLRQARRPRPRRRGRDRLRTRSARVAPALRLLQVREFSVAHQSRRAAAPLRDLVEQAYPRDVDPGGKSACTELIGPSNEACNGRRHHLRADRLLPLPALRADIPGDGSRRTASAPGGSRRPAGRSGAGLPGPVRLGPRPPRSPWAPSPREGRRRRVDRGLLCLTPPSGRPLPGRHRRWRESGSGATSTLLDPSIDGRVAAAVAPRVDRRLADLERRA